MAQVGTLVTFTSGTKAVSADVNSNFAALKTGVNSIDSTQIADSALLTATTHGDLSGSTSTMHSATSVKLTDAALRYTATELEAGMAEVAAYVGMKTGAVALSYKWVGFSYHQTVPGSVSVTVPASFVTSATSKIIVDFGYNMQATPTLLTVNLNDGTNNADLSQAAHRYGQFEIAASYTGAGDLAKCIDISTANGIPTADTFTWALDFTKAYTLTLSHITGTGVGYWMKVGVI